MGKERNTGRMVKRMLVIVSNIHYIWNNILFSIKCDYDKLRFIKCYRKDSW